MPVPTRARRALLAALALAAIAATATTGAAQAMARASRQRPDRVRSDPRPIPPGADGFITVGQPGAVGVHRAPRFTMRQRATVEA